MIVVLSGGACGGRTAIDLDRSLPSEPPAGGAGGVSALPRVSWDEITWDTVLDRSAVYLWTGSPNDTWAVTSAGASDVPGLGAFYRDHWDGSGWARTVAEFDPSQRFGEQQVWAAPSGQAFSGSSRNGQRWSGQTWSDWPSAPNCRAFGGSAENDLWCATESELWRFDGAQWTHQTMSGIRGILANERDDVWVWGTEGAHHFDGTRWSVERMGLVRRVSASERTDVWALQDGDLFHSGGPGTIWTRQNPTGSQISGLWSEAKDNTWIAAAGAVMRWDGAAWTLVPLPTQDEWLLISGSHEDVWIAGTLMLIHGRPRRTF